MTSHENAFVELDSTLSLIQIKGSDAAKFLQGQITADVRELEDRIAFSACCDHKGRIQANFWIWQQADHEYFLLLPHSMHSILLEHLKKYAVFSKVELAVVSSAWKIFQASLTHPEKISEDIKLPTEIYKKAIINDGICSKIPGENRYLIVAPNHSNVAEHFIPPIQKTNPASWDNENITSGIAFIYPPTQNLFTPQMINLERNGGVSFNKGCYVGQEVIARTQHLGTLKRHLCRGEIHSATTLLPGDTLINENNEALGVIIESYSDPQSITKFLAVVQDRAQIEAASSIKLTTLTHEPLTFLEKC